MYSFLKKSLAAFASLFVAAPLWAQTTVENPQPDANVSGISLVSGWRCSAGNITVSFDGGTQYPVSYGTIREDTAAVCGDTNNGFGFLWNWGRLSDGSHTVQLFDDGVEFANININVLNYGAEFLTGVTNSTFAPNFPAAGETATLTWQQSLQNFVVSKTESLSPPASGLFNVAGTFALSNCTAPGNNTSHEYTTTLGISPDRYGFLGTINPFSLGPDLQGSFSLDGSVYGETDLSAAGGVRGILTPVSGSGDIFLRGYFYSSVTSTTLELDYTGVASFLVGGGICQFDGRFTATRIP